MHSHIIALPHAQFPALHARNAGVPAKRNDRDENTLSQISIIVDLIWPCNLKVSSNTVVINKLNSVLGAGFKNGFCQFHTAPES